MKIYLKPIGWMLVFTALVGCNNAWVRNIKQVQDPASGPVVRGGEVGQTVSLSAGEHYKRRQFHSLLWGTKYREEWAVPVEVPVFNLQAGGYSIIKQGGGRQSLSLQLKDQKGCEYVLRSVDKDPVANVPSFFKAMGTVIKDQNSSAHPYASLTLPPMAEAIGVFHTNPHLYYIPYDEALGEHKTTFGGVMAIMEHRPDKDKTGFDYLGNAKNINSTGNMLDNLLKDNSVQVDRHHYLRSRLFDMLLGDWSRHEDNWRWAQFEEEGSTLYKAVPRDRDHVYYHLDGAMPKMLRFFGVKKNFRSFGPHFDNLVALNTSGRVLDEMVLAQLSREDWKALADSLQRELTDEVIVQGVRQLPKAAYDINGEWIIQSLKARRDALPTAVMEYYKALAKKPVVYGTDKHEKFIVRAQGKNLHLEVWQASKKGKERQLLLRRTFLASETKEITLLGFAGNDTFVFEGDGASPIRVKVYGGADDDSFEQNSGKKAPARITLYDTKVGNSYQLAKGIKVKRQLKPTLENFDANGRLLTFYIWD